MSKFTERSTVEVNPRVREAAVPPRRVRPRRPAIAGTGVEPRAATRKARLGLSMASMAEASPAAPVLHTRG